MRTSIIAKQYGPEAGYNGDEVDSPVVDFFWRRTILNDFETHLNDLVR